MWPCCVVESLGDRAVRVTEMEIIMTGGNFEKCVECNEEYIFSYCQKEITFIDQKTY